MRIGQAGKPLGNFFQASGKPEITTPEMKAASFVSEKSGLPASVMLPSSDDRRLAMADQLSLLSEGHSPTSSAADLDGFSGIGTTVRGGSSEETLGELSGMDAVCGTNNDVAADAAAAVRDITTVLTGTWETVSSNGSSYKISRLNSHKKKLFF